MCVNYGGRAEVADAARSIAREVAAGRLNPDRVDERIFARHLYVPELPDADLVWRTSGEQRLSNFMLWQAAYSEFVFTDVLWPDVDRRHLWRRSRPTHAATDATAAPSRTPGDGAVCHRMIGPTGPVGAVREAQLNGSRGRCRRSPACGRCR